MDDESASTSRLDDLPAYTVPAILLGVPALAVVLSLLWPAFYDHVIWQYYWGPIKADALGRASMVHDGVVAKAGYNFVNTLSWAVLLGVCLLGITQLLQGLRIRFNNTAILGATAWVVTGAVWHVIEDTDLIQRPLQYFFITPPIYLMFGAFGILSILVGVYMQRVAKASDLGQGLQKLWMILSIGVLLYTLMWVADWSQAVAYIHPIHVALFAAVTFFLVRWRVIQTGRIEPREVLLMLALFPFLMAMDFVALYLAEPWTPSGGGIPLAAVWAPLLAGAMAGMVWATARAARSGETRDLIPLAGFALAFVAALAWATEDSVGFVAVLGFLAMAAALTGIGALFATLMRKRADMVAAIALAIAAIAGVLVARIVLGLIASRFLEGADISLWIWALSVVLIGGMFFRGRESLREAFTRLKAQGGVTDRSILVYMLPINLVLVFSQMVDAFATSIGLDVGHYSEKHVLSAFIIDAFRDFSESIGWHFGAAYPTFLAFAPVKLLVSLAVVWAIDIYSREDLKKYPTLIGLVKFAIIMVGIGPGVRDFVRMALGV